MNVEAGFQLSDLGGAVRRRAKIVVGLALAIGLASYWVAMALPNEYESYATVLVEPQSVDPDLVEAGVPQSDLNRRLHLMAAQVLSRPKLSRIIDDLDLYVEENRYLVRDQVIDLMRNQIRIEPVLPEMEQAGLVRNRVEIDQFRIFFRDHSPLVARDVAQRLANDFIQAHIAQRVEISQKSVEFVQAELQRLAEEIRRVEGQIAAVKNENPGRRPEDMVANQRLFERLTVDLGLARRAVASSSSDVAFYTTQSASARDLVVREDRDSPQGRVRILELALADYDARGFTDKHPDVVKARAELETLETQIATRAAEGGPASFAQHSADAEAQRAARRREDAQAEVAHLEERMLEVQTLLATAPGVAEQLDGLDREYRHLFESYQDFSNKRLEASVQADLERRQLGEQFRVLEAAFLAPGPSSPNRMIIVAIGIIFGLALGGATGILLEATDSSVHTARQLQASLNLPVLAAIPNIALESDRARERRSLVRTVALAAGVTLFVLVGGLVNYRWVNAAPGAAQPATPAVAERPAAGPQ